MMSGGVTRPADYCAWMAGASSRCLARRLSGQCNGAHAADAAVRIRLATQSDRDGLDLFTVADHPYVGDKLVAYALTGPARPGLNASPAW